MSVVIGAKPAYLTQSPPVTETGLMGIKEMAAKVQRTVDSLKTLGKL